MKEISFFFFLRKSYCWRILEAWLSSVQFSCSVMSDFSRPHRLQHARPPCPSPSLGTHPDSGPSSWWCRPAISSSVAPFPSCPQSFPSITVFSKESVFHIRWPKCRSFNFSISSSNEHPGLISFSQDGLVGYPFSLRDSQESFPTPQFKSINSLVLSLLYSPNLTSIHDYWKNHSFD